MQNEETNFRNTRWQIAMNQNEVHLQAGFDSILESVMKTQSTPNE